MFLNVEQVTVLPQLSCFDDGVILDVYISRTYVCLLHSKFHTTSNHFPPTTDSSRTARTPLYPPVQAVPPYSLPPSFLSYLWQRNRRRSVPVPVTGVHYNSLLWMCMSNTLTWPDLTWPDLVYCSSVGELYFKVEKLRGWSGRHQQSLAGFEKIRTVGKGNNKLTTWGPPLCAI